MTFLQRFRRLFCEHEIWQGHIKRVGPNEVTCRCLKCGAELSAEYGLALPAKFVGKPQ